MSAWKLATFVCTFALLLVGSLEADIINVPDDEESIQDAIDAADDGDTVLVAPGEYTENLDMPDVEMTVGSLFLTTGNEAYIDSTIINGSDGFNVSAVIMEGASDELLFTGFTVTGGSGNYGGGFLIEGCAPTLTHLKIIENTVTWRGGGIYCTFGGDATITNVHFLDNTAPMGGAMSIDNSDTDIYRCVFAGNEASGEGGAIYSNVDLELLNCTFTKNENDRGSGVYLMMSDITLRNCIFWDNPDADIFEWGSGDIDIDYCLFEDGEDGVHEGDVAFGENNLDEDPGFVDPDEHDYHLAAGSPCIDAGDPDSPDDPDGSRADIGALPVEGGGFGSGYVFDAANDEPIAGATVVTSNNQMATTDSSGYWEMSPMQTGVFDLTASAAGYNDSTLFELELERDDTLEVSFSLLHPEIMVDDEGVVDMRVEPGDSANLSLTISNSGNGILEWAASALPTNLENTEPWAEVVTHAIEAEVNDSRLEAVVFSGEEFYVAGRNDDGDEDVHMIYVLDRDGALMRCFEQPNPEHRFGMTDLAWDHENEILWGAVEQTVYAFNSDGDSLTSFAVDLGGRSSIQALAWDYDRNLLWLSSVVSDVYAYDTEGNVVDTLGRGDSRFYGLAYNGLDPDGLPIYSVDNDNGNGTIIYKAAPDSEWVLEKALPLAGGEELGGIGVTGSYHPLITAFVGLVNSPDGDRVQVWQLDVNSSWIEVAPEMGELAPEEEDEVVVTLFSADLDTGAYNLDIVIIHNSAGDEIRSPVTLEVYEVVDRVELDNTVPSVFGITSTYPNPFNSTLKIDYRLEKAGVVKLVVYSMDGRQVSTLEGGYRTAGEYTDVWEVGGLPSGAYMLRLDAGSRSASQKVLLLK